MKKKLVVNLFLKIWIRLVIYFGFSYVTIHYVLHLCPGHIFFTTKNQYMAKDRLNNQLKREKYKIQERKRIQRRHRAQYKKYLKKRMKNLKDDFSELKGIHYLYHSLI